MSPANHPHAPLRIASLVPGLAGNPGALLRYVGARLHEDVSSTNVVCRALTAAAAVLWPGPAINP